MSEVVCELASRQTRLVEPRRDRLAERVARRTPGKDARQSQRIRPILIVLVLFVLISAAVWAALFLTASTTKNDVRRLVQTQCRLASTSFAGDVSIEGEGIGGTARVPYVDSTGSHTAIVRLGADGAYSLDTCGR